MRDGLDVVSTARPERTRIRQFPSDVKNDFIPCGAPATGGAKPYGEHLRGMSPADSRCRACCSPRHPRHAPCDVPHNAARGCFACVAAVGDESRAVAWCMPVCGTACRGCAAPPCRDVAWPRPLLLPTLQRHRQPSAGACGQFPLPMPSSAKCRCDRRPTGRHQDRRNFASTEHLPLKLAIGAPTSASMHLRPTFCRSAAECLHGHQNILDAGVLRAG